MSGNLVFSRNFTISKPKDKVNYILLGGQISERGGGIFTRKHGPSRGGGKFLGGGQISCDTGPNTEKHRPRSGFLRTGNQQIKTHDSVKPYHKAIYLTLF